MSGAEYDDAGKTEYEGIRQKSVPTIERRGLAAVSSSASTHFSLVRTAVCSLITSSPSAVRYQHPRFPRRSYASAVPWMPHSNHC